MIRTMRLSPLWIAVIVLMLFQTLSYFDKQIFGVLAPPLGQSLDLSDVELGLLLGVAFAIPYSVGTLCFGWAADRYSPRNILFVCVLLWSLAAFSTGLASSFVGVMFARMLLGLGESALQPCAYKILVEVSPPARLGLAGSLYTAGGILGSAGTLIVAGSIMMQLTEAGGADLPLIGHVEPWQASFMLLSLPGIILCSAAFLLPRLKPRAPVANGAAGESGASIFGLVREQRLLLFCHFGTLTLLGISLFAIMSWAPVYMTRKFGMDIGAIGLIMGVATAAGAIGGIFWGAVSDWLRARGSVTVTYRMYVPLCTISAATGGAAFLVDSEPLFTALLILSTVSGNFSALALVMPFFVPRDLIGRLFGFQSFIFGSFGAGFAPLLVAFLTESLFGDPSSVGMAIGLIVALCGVGSAILLAVGVGPLASAVAGRHSVDQSASENPAPPANGAAAAVAPAA